MTRTHDLRNPAAVFTAAAAVVVAACAAIVRSHLFHADPEILSWAVTLDLTITVPAVYWLLVVRSGRARPATIAPVFVAGAAIAALLLPRGQQAFLHQLRLVAIPLDVITVVLIVRRLLHLRRQQSVDDAEGQIRRAAQAVFGEGVVSSIFATELSIGWYALFGWRRKPVVPRGSRAVTVHERSGWGSVVAGVLVLIAAESVGMHLLLQLWSAKAAWIATALDVYGMMWLIGDYHALRLRPTLVRSDSIEIRHGLRWSATIERTNIASIDRPGGEEQWKRRATLRLALLDDPQFLIALRTPVVATGIAGRHKSIDAIAIRPDDAAAFLEALEAPRDDV